MEGGLIWRIKNKEHVLEGNLSIQEWSVEHHVQTAGWVVDYDREYRPHDGIRRNEPYQGAC